MLSGSRSGTPRCNVLRFRRAFACGRADRADRVLGVQREVGRREFLAMLGAAGVLAACSSSKAHRVGAPGAGRSTASAPTVLPEPGDAPFDTVVVLTMENRSFDHLLGWLPGADGKQA